MHRLAKSQREDGGTEKAGMVISLGNKHKENGCKEIGLFPIQGKQQRDPDKRRLAC